MQDGVWGTVVVAQWAGGGVGKGGGPRGERGTERVGYKQGGYKQGAAITRNCKTGGKKSLEGRRARRGTRAQYLYLVVIEHLQTLM